MSSRTVCRPYTALDAFARRGPVVVGWVAAFEHVADARSLDLATVVSRLLEERPDVQFETVGLALDLEHPRYRRHGVVDYTHLASLTERFDVGIAPLVDTPFGRSRSNVKVKEYAAHGIPWLASDFGPYHGLGEAEGGRLVGDDDWLEAMIALVDDRRGRKRLGEAAHLLGENRDDHGERRRVGSDTGYGR